MRRYTLLLHSITIVFMLSCYSICFAGINDGLVAYYPFEGNVNDASGKGLNGMAYGGLTYVGGIQGQAASLDGINDFIRVADNVSLRLSNTNFTLSAWVYEKSRDVSWADAILCKRGSGNEDGWHISISGELSSTTVGVGYLLYRVSGRDDPYISSLVRISLNEWHHILMVYDKNNSTATMYVDGMIDRTKSNIPSPNPNTSEDLFIGKDSSGDFAYYFDGLIDEVRIYNRALTSDEIVELYNWNDLDGFANKIKKTDIDKDKDIDGKDLSIFLKSYGSLNGYPNFDPNSDFDNNGEIDKVDLAIFTYMYGKEDTHLYISGCKYLLKNEGLIGENLNSLSDQNCYDFSLNEPKTIAIISTGNLDLKGEIFEVLNGIQNPIDADKDGIVDAGDKRISNEFSDKDIPPVVHNNFMLRPGVGAEGEKRILPAGHYRVYVAFDDDAFFVEDEYGLILLKTSQIQNERNDDFFAGIKALIEDDGNYEDNDYLDIYVQALFPDIYDTNWFSTIDYNGVIAERQCKALPNFFVKYIFGQDEFLYNDCTIDDHLSSNDPDWVLRGLATTIFNDMSVQLFGDISDAMRGDVWVKDMGLTCLDGNRQSGFNHYGLYFDSGSILDANWSDPTDGKLRISITRTPNKIVRPEN